MTIKEIAVVEEQPRAVALAETDSWIPVLADVANLAERIAGTEFVPRGLRDSAPAVAAAILYGREVGLSPMTALNVTHVIEGKPAISAEGMRAMVFAAGHEIVIEESTGAQCIVKGRRRGTTDWTRIGWTLDMARAAGVGGKQVWQRYPRQMLQARATAELCRLVFPDVTHGFRAVEEIDDGYEDGPPLPGSVPGETTRVARRRTPAKKAAAAQAPPPAERPERPAGPPLPGEDGYETSAGDSAPETSLASGSEPSMSPAEPQTDDTGPVGDPDVEGGDGADPDGTAEQEDPAGEGEGEAPEPAGNSEPAARGPRGPRKATRAQHRMIFALLEALGVDKDNEDRHDIAAAITHRKIESFNDLTHDNASAVIDTLGRVKTREELDELLAAAANAEADRWNQGDRS